MQTLFPNETNFDQNTPPRQTPPNSLDRWVVLKQRLKAKLDPEQYEAWIEPLSASRQDDQEIVVTLPNIVFYQGIHNQYLGVIVACKDELGMEGITLKFELDQTAAQEAPFQESENAATQPAEELAIAEASKPSQGFSKSLSTSHNLNLNYKFETYVRGDSNQFAVATCLSAAENPGKAYNPLFIYGSTGLGKTHLLHAVGLRVLEINPNAVVCYISSERFMNEMIYCLRFNKMWDFRQKYRNCDVFLVDDIQFISGKKATQEEFFHTFNTLYAAKKQIVITSDLFPKDIPDIEDRLRNRFQWGLIADIQPPDIEHRIAILFSKAEKLGIRLSEDVAEYIAKHAKRNVRELEGALHRINAFAALQGEPITMDLAVHTFKDVLGEPPRSLTIENVQKTVADYFKIRITDLKSKKRHRALAQPRQIAMFLARKLTNASFPEIGGKFGGKDHTTVMHNVRKIDGSLQKDLDLKAHVEALERQLEQLQ